MTRQASQTDPPAGRSDDPRAVLGDFITLMGKCVREEAEIESRRTAALAQYERRRGEAFADIQQRHQTLEAEIQVKHTNYLQDIDKRYQADQAKLAHLQNTARDKIELDHATVEKHVKQQIKQEKWLAESVFEALQHEARDDEKKQQKAYSTRLANLKSLAEQASATLHHFGQAWPEAPDANDATGAEDFTAEFEATESALQYVMGLRLPRFNAGILPVFSGLLLCAGAAVLAYFWTGGNTTSWLPYAAAVGPTALVAILAGLILRSTGRKQVAAAAQKLRMTLLRAQTAAKTEFDQATQQRQERLAAGAAKRDADVQAVKARYAPMLGKAVKTSEEHRLALKQERDRMRPRIEAQKEAALQETQAWHLKALETLKQGHENELHAAQRTFDAEARQLADQFDQQRSDLEARWGRGLQTLEEFTRRTRLDDMPATAQWDAPGWSQWSPTGQQPSAVRFGLFHVDPVQLVAEPPKKLPIPQAFDTPAALSFPDHASLMIRTDAAGRTAALAAIKALMLRLLVSMPPGRVRFTLIDPVGLGQSFAGFMHLADDDEALVGGRIWTESEHIDQRLADLTEHMETVIQKYLRNEFPTIDAYNTQAGELAEPYRFLVIADFPVNFSEIAVQRLNSIAGTGARCGVNILMVQDTRQPLPAGTHIDALQAASINILRENNRFVWKDEIFRTLPLALDAPPSEERITELLHRVGRAAQDAKRIEVPFDSIAPAATELWTARSQNDINVPIGRLGATRLQTLRLGRGMAQHALIAGKTGSGKSTLLHVLVTNLALWYHPQEVEFYLVDFKKGVEFKSYATFSLPHARAVAVESDREFGLSVLQRVDAELTRRGEMFRKHGVQDLAGYRAESAQPLPRTLLIIDEFQEFFSEDDRLAQEAGLLLDRLVRQGRAFGIHVLLGSQTIGGTSGLARSTISQMAVRIALQTTETDSQIILGDGNSAARLLSRPGEAVYNDAGGLVEANSPFQVAWLADDERDRRLEQIRDMDKTPEASAAPARGELRPTAGQKSDGARRPPAIVFEGNVPADLTANPKLAALLRAEQWPSVPATPTVWLGEPVAIKDPTAVTLRRQSGSNLLIIGQQEEAAMAMFAAALISLAAQHAPDQATMFILDGSPADSPLAHVLPRIASAIPQTCRIIEYRALEDCLRELADEMHNRQNAAQPSPGACYLFIYGLQRYRTLRRQEDSFSFSMNSDNQSVTCDKLFADLLREGPPLGIHTLAWCDTPAAVERTLERSSLREFDHRVLFQMSANDSSNLIDSPAANKLGTHRAIAFSEEQGTLEKFRPYALPGEDWLVALENTLRRRG